MSSPTSPDATATYTLTASPAGAQGRVFVYTAAASSPSLNGNSNVSLGTGDGKGPIPVLVANGTADSPVYLAIVIKDPSGNALTPLAICLRAAAGPLRNQPNSTTTFPSVTVSGTTLTLTDNENDKSSYDFDILFTDGSGNYGLLDPKLQNN